MSLTVTIEEAQLRLGELVTHLTPGEEIVIVQGTQPVAKLVGQAPPSSLQPRQPGSARGKLTIVTEDDEHLADFAEYMR